jgi:hypothetical protein
MSERERPPSKVPLNGEPQILADWLERRVGTRDEAAVFVFKLAAYYAAEIEKRERRNVRAA